MCANCDVETDQLKTLKLLETMDEYNEIVIFKGGVSMITENSKVLFDSVNRVINDKSIKNAMINKRCMKNQYKNFVGNGVYDRWDTKPVRYIVKRHPLW